MAMNQYMHPRNIYRQTRPNFRNLADKYPFFNEVATKDEHNRVTIDFKRPVCLAALTRALLLQDFGLEIELPLDRLVPTVPLRLNYILWLEDILKCCPTKGTPIRVLDIGAGSSCIYPLLGAKKNGWHFIATEKDKRNMSFAKLNVDKNGFQEQIKIVEVEEGTSSLLPPALNQPLMTSLHVDLVMSNPPFFSGSVEAAGQNRASIHDSTNFRNPPKSVSCAARQESQTEGGEVVFVMRLARESVLYKDRVTVFTAMLGKKKSVGPLKTLLHSLNVTQLCVNEMCQGRVMRWGIAWTFCPDISFPKSEYKRKKLQERKPLTWPIPRDLACVPCYSSEAIYHRLKEMFELLKIQCLEQKTKANQGGGKHLLIVATEDTWTHQRQKKRHALHQPLPDVTEQDAGSTTQSGQNLLKREGEGHLVSPVPAKRARTNSELEVCAEGDAWEDCADSAGPGGDSSDSVMSELLRAGVYVDKATGGVLEGDKLILRMVWIDGESKESMNQVLCYLKNKLK